jgi:SET domain-containing protein
MSRSSSGKRENPRIKKVSVKKSRVHARGVFAERDFDKGETIIVLDDSQPVPDRSKLRPEQAPEIDVFIGIDGKRKIVFTKPPERYINTSCDPNAITETDMKSGVRKAVALKHIRKGDEITFDYAINSDEEWEIPIPCNCGSKNCRGMIHGNYFTLPRETQTRYLPLLDEPFRRRFKEEIASLGLSEER